MDKQTAIVLFKEKAIRRTWHNGGWWFSVVDICAVLTNSVNAGAYWRKLKQRLSQEGSESVTFCHGLKLPASDGKKYVTDCASTEGVLRIIQSIPFSKAQPFKRWLKIFQLNPKIIKLASSSNFAMPFIYTYQRPYPCSL